MGNKHTTSPASSSSSAQSAAQFSLFSKSEVVAKAPVLNGVTMFSMAASNNGDSSSSVYVAADVLGLILQFCEFQSINSMRRCSRQCQTFVENTWKYDRQQDYNLITEFVRQYLCSDQALFIKTLLTLSGAQDAENLADAIFDFRRKILSHRTITRPSFDLQYLDVQRKQMVLALEDKCIAQDDLVRIRFVFRDKTSEQHLSLTKSARQMLFKSFLTLYPLMLVQTSWNNLRADSPESRQLFVAPALVINDVIVEISPFTGLIVPVVQEDTPEFVYELDNLAMQMPEGDVMAMLSKAIAKHNQGVIGDCDHHEQTNRFFSNLLGKLGVLSSLGYGHRQLLELYEQQNSFPRPVPLTYFIKSESLPYRLVQQLNITRIGLVTADSSAKPQQFEALRPQDHVQFDDMVMQFVDMHPIFTRNKDYLLLKNLDGLYTLRSRQWYKNTGRSLNGNPYACGDTCHFNPEYQEEFEQQKSALVNMRSVSRLHRYDHMDKLRALEYWNQDISLFDGVIIVLDAEYESQLFGRGLLPARKQTSTFFEQRHSKWPHQMGNTQTTPSSQDDAFQQKQADDVISPFQPLEMPVVPRGLALFTRDASHSPSVFLPLDVMMIIISYMKFEDISSLRVSTKNCMEIVETARQRDAAAGNVSIFSIRIYKVLLTDIPTIFLHISILHIDFDIILEFIREFLCNSQSDFFEVVLWRQFLQRSMQLPSEALVDIFQQFRKKKRHHTTIHIERPISRFSMDHSRESMNARFSARLPLAKLNEKRKLRLLFRDHSEANSACSSIAQSRKVLANEFLNTDIYSCFGTSWTNFPEKDTRAISQRGKLFISPALLLDDTIMIEVSPSGIIVPRVLLDNTSKSVGTHMQTDLVPLASESAAEVLIEFLVRSISAHNQTVIQGNAVPNTFFSSLLAKLGVLEHVTLGKRLLLAYCEQRGFPRPVPLTYILPKSPGLNIPGNVKLKSIELEVDDGKAKCRYDVLQPASHAEFDDAIVALVWSNPGFKKHEDQGLLQNLDDLYRPDAV